MTKPLERNNVHHPMCVMGQVPRVTSCVSKFFSVVIFLSGQIGGAVGGGSVINRAYPV